MSPVAPASVVIKNVTYASTLQNNMPIPVAIWKPILYVDVFAEIVLDISHDLIFYSYKPAST